MPVPTSITDCNATAANNSPAGSDSIGTSLDDYLRAHAAIIRQVYDALVVVDGTLLPKAGGSVTGTITTTHQIKGITPVANEDLARKDYVDTKLIGNGPAFTAQRTSVQIAGSGVDTPIIFNTEIFDTASAYDTVTGAFNPQIAGYYQIACSAVLNGDSSLTSLALSLVKNGATNYGSGLRGSWGGQSVSAIIYFNGTTDYVQAYVNIVGAANVYVDAASSRAATFSGALIRAA